MQTGNVIEVFKIFLRLGLTSFGGPVAHLAYFRAEFVERRKWLSDQAYADLVALCQFLPGPASSQVGLAIGLSRAGYAGALAAWTAFTLPSAIALILFAYGLTSNAGLIDSGWLHGLKIAAVAVVASAVLGMARALAPDKERATLAVAAAAITLFMPSVLGQICAIILGGIVGTVLYRDIKIQQEVSLPLTISRQTGIIALSIFFILLAGLPLISALMQNHTLSLIDAFYRSGSLVFGGGHVVLPLLQSEVVPTGWMSGDAFLAGYGAAQAVPGPLFTFAAYLGAALQPSPNGWIGAAICLLAIFLPSFLLVVGVLPFWNEVRKKPAIQAVLKGVNAAVVGLLLAALYSPVWTSAIFEPTDFALGIAAFLALFMWRVPPWLVVVLCAGTAQFYTLF